VSGLIQELRGNPRLAAGLGVIAALLWVWGLLEVQDATARLQASHAELQNRMVRLKSLAAQSHWPAHREAAVSAVATYRARTWREQSEGRMQAVMQDWLREKIAATGAQPLELTVSIASEAPPTPGVQQRSTPGAAPALPAGVRVMRARVVLDFQPVRLNELLAAVSASPNWLWVSRMSVREEGRRVVELELEALFLAGAREGS